jgi:hypothetical protein
LEISRTLAEADPSDAQKQVDLWILLVRLAHVWIRKGDFAKVLPNLASGMATGERELSKNSQFFNPYNLACFRSLEVLQHSLQNPEPDQTQVTERERLEADAIQSLQLLIDGGFRNFASIQHPASSMTLTFRRFVACPSSRRCSRKKRSSRNRNVGTAPGTSHARRNLAEPASSL